MPWGSGLSAGEAEQISVHGGDRTKKHLLVGLSSGVHTQCKHPVHLIHRGL